MFINKNALENIVCEMAAILSRGAELKAYRRATSPCHLTTSFLFGIKSRYLVRIDHLILLMVFESYWAFMQRCLDQQV